jgi:hypothetical protein
MPEKVRVEGNCRSCQGSLHVMLTNEHDELVALECVSCHKRLGLNIPWKITIEQAGWLGDLIHGVERGCKMHYYPMGAKDADHPMAVVLRAFTYEGGGLYPHDEDIRESYVWCSGIIETWLKVGDVLDALENAVTCKFGDESPMAIIDKE